ncbi:unnamed protein product [Prorocentrum cordatum]|uniref:Guanylate cyclase domain-containing protein n=1 Tax=Prorocentrum cordatum TaxID=2364126 RepID=A0ABN9T7V4_9DINO|nr:unnamed protein product [Polarella glacialis]
MARALADGDAGTSTGSFAPVAAKLPRAGIGEERFRELRALTAAAGPIPVGKAIHALHYLARRIKALQKTMRCGTAIRKNRAGIIAARKKHKNAQKHEGHPAAVIDAVMRDAPRSLPTPGAIFLALFAMRSGTSQGSYIYVSMSTVTGLKDRFERMSSQWDSMWREVNREGQTAEQLQLASLPIIVPPLSRECYSDCMNAVKLHNKLASDQTSPKQRHGGLRRGALIHMRDNKFVPAVHTPAHRKMEVIDRPPQPERRASQANWRADREVSFSTRTEFQAIRLRETVEASRARFDVSLSSSFRLLFHGQFWLTFSSEALHVAARQLQAMPRRPNIMSPVVDGRVESAPMAASPGSPLRVPPVSTASPALTTRSTVTVTDMRVCSPCRSVAQSPPNGAGQEICRAAREGDQPFDNAEVEDHCTTAADSMRTMPAHVRRVTTTSALSSQTQGSPVRDQMTKASSIMMDVMRLMSKTGYISTSGSNLSLTPATIVREQHEADDEARMPTRRCGVSVAVVGAAFFALISAACLGVVLGFFEHHGRMLAEKAEGVFRRYAEQLHLRPDDPVTQSAIEQGVLELQDELQSMCDATRLMIVVALLIVLGVGTAIVGTVGILMSRKLRLLGKLNELMEKLSTLNLSMDSEEFSRFCRGRRSNMHEIAQLQDTFDRLTKCIVLFARFVPETVVQRIVHGDRRATRLYVDNRCATIMFSDIKDFTSLSEQFAHLNPRSMLFLLTRYFSVMTHIVEAYEGTVGEILGDGLLVFWNTPESVRNHATKACAAALAQQVALKYLNQHFASMGLPQLEIRIGLHTGQVLTGNFGSLTKMKFGCMGDTVNLASRLEGLCKVYGVGIVCSGSTHGALAQKQGFLCRRLDRVKVKGRDEPTEVYEVIGRDETSILPAAFQEAADSAAAHVSNAGTVHSVGCKRSARFSRGSSLAPRIQDVVIEAIGGLYALCRGVNDGLESIWDDLSFEEDVGKPNNVNIIIYVDHGRAALEGRQVRGRPDRPAAGGVLGGLPAGQRAAGGHPGRLGCRQIARHGERWMHVQTDDLNG